MTVILAGILFAILWIGMGIELRLTEIRNAIRDLKVK